MCKEEHRCWGCEFEDDCEFAEQYNFCEDCKDYYTCDMCCDVMCEKGYCIECNNGFEDKDDYCCEYGDDEEGEMNYE